MTIEELKRDELAGLCILVVDDEPETLELVAHTLRSVGAEVIEAAGADQALERLESSAPQVLVSDLQMPDGDGFALMERIRAKRIPIVGIALSANASIHDAKRALDAGFAVHIGKPIAMQDLVDTIRTAAPPPQLRRG